MRLFRHLLLLCLLSFLAACNTATAATPTSLPTEIPTRPSLPTLTPLGLFPSSQPTALQMATVIRPATSVLPATITPAPIQQQASLTRTLNNGRGLTTGRSVSNGEFEVEGYCALLNPSYGVSEDGVNWFCTFQSQPALLLRQDNFDDICRRTYNNANAVAIQSSNGQPIAYQWRCIEYTITPTPTPQRFPVLLNNGRGMTTGRTMNNGEVEVEGYCSAINPTYGVSEDGNFWYCTQNGQRILTLGVAEFDDICIRTYNNPAAFAEQAQGSQAAAYRWRCYILQ